MFCIIYVYAALGVAFFGGKVSKDKDSVEFEVLSNMAFGESGYWTINFNDMPSGFVLMVQLLVVNNWMVFTEAFVAVTSPTAFIFFCSFYLFGVIAGPVPLILCADGLCYSRPGFACLRKLDAFYSIGMSTSKYQD